MRNKSTVLACCLMAFALWSAPGNASGALVSSPIKGNYIYMTHRPSPDIAVGLAMSDCTARYGGGCRVVTAYGNGCLAIAHSHDGTHHSGWAVKPSMSESQVFALGQCAKYGGPCSVDVSTCE